MRGVSGIVVVIGALLIGACGDDGGASGADATDGLSGGDVAAAADADAVGADADDGALDAQGEDTAAPPVEAWSAPGDYRVGYLSETLTYDALDGSGERSLRLVAWYPTRDEAGDEVLYAGLLAAPGVLGGASVAAEAAPMPVVVFSHGNTSFAEQSFFFTEFLATHGFVVLAPDHTGNTFAGGSTPVEIFHWRPQDIGAILDHLEALPAEHPLEGLVSDRVAVSGHSFGGYTTLAAGGATWAVDLVLAFCESGALPLGGCDALEAHDAMYREGFGDTRISALLPMTPGATQVFGPSGAGAVTAPTLLFTGARDATTPNATEGDPTWAALSSGADHLRVDFANGGHFTFSDACSLPLGIGADDGCSDSFIDPPAAHAAINAYSLAFLRRHLLDDEGGAPLLDGEVAIEADVSLSIGGVSR